MPAVHFFIVTMSMEIFRSDSICFYIVGTHSGTHTTCYLLENALNGGFLNEVLGIA